MSSCIGDFHLNYPVQYLSDFYTYVKLHALTFSIHLHDKWKTHEELQEDQTARCPWQLDDFHTDDSQKSNIRRCIIMN